jgi:lipoate-protein ligase A
MLRAEYKAEGGKLIKVQLRRDGDRIGFIRITGDFFMHPEDLIEDFEKALLGCPINEDAIVKVIRDFICGRGIILLGAKPEDFAKGIGRAGGGVG